VLLLMQKVCHSPAIIVLGYNRPGCTLRLLESLKKTHWADSSFTPSLIISIDKGDSAVMEIAHSFTWDVGEKRVVQLDEHFGVRRHVFQCGALAEEFGSIIMLEDDLVVAPYFYEYATQCIEFYKDDANIAGGALYHHQLNETAKRAFLPMQDGSDVYFLRLAASWGQFWTGTQWKAFREWCELRTHKDIEAIAIPWDVKKWPWSSWKKWFTAYLVDQGKYVVYPRFSQSTNFMESGTHNPVKAWDFQTELDCTSRDWRFKNINDSIARYDAYCEIDPNVLKDKHSDLKNYDFEVDLYGVKRVECVQKPFMLTTRPVKNAILGFDRSLRPDVANVIFNMNGVDIQLAKTRDCQESWEPWLRYEINYFFSVPDKLLGKMIYQHMESSSFWVGIKAVFRLFYNRIKRFLTN